MVTKIKISDEDPIETAMYYIRQARYATPVSPSHGYDMLTIVLQLLWLYQQLATRHGWVSHAPREGSDAEEED